MTTDVLIIGAGPCGLAVAARLSESTPSALFTDDEHARYWKRFQRKETVQREARRKRKDSSDSSITSDCTHGGETGKAEQASRPSMVVLDSTSNDWLGAWTARFSALHIQHLRSPLFFHPDPRDKDGLLAYAYEQGREGELVEIDNVAGKEYSKHARKQQRQKRRPQQHGGRVERHLRVDGRDRIDYHTPSTALFEDYCRSLIKRYHLQGMVQKATVRTITYDKDDASRVFTVSTDQGPYLARIIVIATGASVQPALPADHKLRLTEISQTHVSHVFQPNGLHLSPSTLHKLHTNQPTQIAVVGGGLTSAQLAVSLLTRDEPITHVHLLLRGRYKLKPFDVAVEWVSKVRNGRMAEFWGADTDGERAEMLRTAKNGGSVPPAFDRRSLQPWIRAGRLSMHAHTCIAAGVFDEALRTWTLQMTSKSGGGNNGDTSGDDGKLELARIDHVFFATGVKPDFGGICFLQQLRAEHPLETIDGLPVINEDLMYNADVPMLVTGALGALRLGPGAANLAGARHGAERVAWKVEELLGGKGGGVAGGGVAGGGGGGRGEGLNERGKLDYKSKSTTTKQDRSEFTGGFVNQFHALGLDEPYRE